jgi:hypothetical protein
LSSGAAAIAHNNATNSTCTQPGLLAEDAEDWVIR